MNATKERIKYRLVFKYGISRCFEFYNKQFDKKRNKFARNIVWHKHIDGGKFASSVLTHKIEHHNTSLCDVTLILMSPTCTKRKHSGYNDRCFHFMDTCYFVREKAYQHRTHPLHWRHNGHISVSNYQPHDCLLNRLSRRRSKKTSKPRFTDLCVGIHRWPVNSPHKWPVTRKMFLWDVNICSIIGILLKKCHYFS